MTVKLIHHAQRQTIGHPFGHVNWEYVEFDMFRLRAQSNCHQQVWKPRVLLTDRL
jgi:hypothetical protein